jgi:hypothetical protein
MLSPYLLLISYQLCSGREVDRFQQHVVDRHPETTVVRAGINDVHPI